MEKVPEMRGELLSDMLLDSDIIIDLMRGYRPAREFIEKVDEINISIFTKLELLDGARNKSEQNRIEKILKFTNVLYGSTVAQKQADRLFSRYHLSKGIGIPDSLLASTAIDYGLTLVTRNKKHFSFIEELDLLIPY